MSKSAHHARQALLRSRLKKIDLIKRIGRVKQFALPPARPLQFNPVAEHADVFHILRRVVGDSEARAMVRDHAARRGRASRPVGSALR